MNGLDYAGWRPAPGWLKANGYSFVCRYLSWLPNSKVISKPEFDGLRSAGIAVVLNWEFDSQDALGGRSAGVRNATEALRQARALGVGQPTIYFSVDWDVSPGQIAVVISYLQGVAAVLGGPQFVGVYGGKRIVTAVLNSGAARYAWQTYAWSGGQWDNRAQLRQVANGTNYDHDTSTTPNFGQVGSVAPSAAPAQTTPGSTIDEEDNEMLQLAPATIDASGVVTAAPAVMFLFPWDGTNHGVITAGCDFGRAKLRIASHKPGGGAQWDVQEVVISSVDDAWFRTNFAYAPDRVSVSRIPVDATDKMQTAVGIRTFYQ